MSTKAIDENIEKLTKKFKTIFLPTINYYKNDYYFTDPDNQCDGDEDLIRNYIYPFISESQVILDIGAHAGTHTISYSSINPSIIMYSFEPQKKMFDLLKYNIKQNKLQNVKLFNNAIGHENKEVFLNNVVTDGPNNNKQIEYGTDSNFNLGGVSLGEYGEEVKMITIDSLNLSIACDFIKIDVEGFEKHVLMGGIKTIEKYKPIILFEYNEKEKQSKGVYELDKKFDEMNIFEFITKILKYELIINTYSQNYLAIYNAEDISKLLNHKIKLQKLWKDEIKNNT